MVYIKKLRKESEEKENSEYFSATNFFFKMRHAYCTSIKSPNIFMPVLLAYANKIAHRILDT